MSTTDAEYQAVSNIARADRNFRIVAYALAGCIFLMIAVGAYELFTYERKQQEQTQHLLSNISDITKQRLRATEQQNEQTRRYITCLFVLPIASRTTEAQQRCLDQSKQGIANYDPAIAVGTASPADRVSVAPSPKTGQNQSIFVPSSKSTPQAQASPSDTSHQPSNNTVQPSNVSTSPSTPPSQPSLLQRITSPVTKLVGGL